MLSAPLRGPYAEASVGAKKDWLDEHNPSATQDAIFTQHKHKYALSNGEPNVLVDDYGKYLNNKSIFGQIYTSANSIKVNDKNDKNIWYYSDRLRNNIITNLQKNNFSKKYSRLYQRSYFIKKKG